MVRVWPETQNLNVQRKIPLVELALPHNFINSEPLSVRVSQGSMPRYTPITACGLNNGIQFDLEDEKYWHQVGHTLAPKELIWNDLLEEPGMALLSVKGTRSGKFPGEVNINVAPARKFIHGLLVNSNFHYPVPRNESGTPQSGRVIEYVEEMWKPALEKARAVAYRIFDKIKTKAG